MLRKKKRQPPRSKLRTVQPQELQQLTEVYPQKNLVSPRTKMKILLVGLKTSRKQVMSVVVIASKI